MNKTKLIVTIFGMVLVLASVFCTIKLGMEGYLQGANTSVKEVAFIGQVHDFIALIGKGFDAILIAMLIVASYLLGKATNFLKWSFPIIVQVFMTAFLVFFDFSQDFTSQGDKFILYAGAFFYSMISMLTGHLSRKKELKWKT